MKHRARLLASSMLALALTLALAAAAATVEPRAAGERYIVGEGGWSSDNAGTGLVTLRASLRLAGARANAPSNGTVLVFCSTSDDRMIFDPYPSPGFRTSEPTHQGTAYVMRSTDPRNAGKMALFSALKLFPSGSFELSDVPSGDRNVAMTLIDDVLKGGSVYSFRLSPVANEARFEREQTLQIEFKVSQQDRLALERFETSCKLLNARK